MTGAGVSVYIRPTIFGNLVFLKSYMKGDKAVADSVRVNCPVVETPVITPTTPPTDTPRPTDPPPPTATRTITATPTITPPTAPTPPPPKAKMSLRVYAGKDKDQEDLVCGAGDVHRKCTLPRGGPFSVDVVADHSSGSARVGLPPDSKGELHVL